jgi:DNA-binding response OmpR family regulator
VVIGKILVDDDPTVSATRIVPENHTVISADSGDSGYRRVKEDKPDLVILDVIMDTVLDGLSLSQRLYDDTALRDVPIIMVTSMRILIMPSCSHR